MQNNVVEKLNLKKQNKNGIFPSGSLHAVNIPRFESRTVESIVKCVYKVCTNRRQVTQDLQFIENQQHAREKFRFTNRRQNLHNNMIVEAKTINTLYTSVMRDGHVIAFILFIFHQYKPHKRDNLIRKSITSISS
jgi:hypothetical protein